MATLAPGDVLAGRFEIRAPLGAGGLAEVYAARDRVAGQDVALKILHPHVARDPKLAERFRHEMSLTRALDHPGIVRVFDLYQDGERPLFSMELLEGETLAERLQRGPVPGGAGLAGDGRSMGDAQRIGEALLEALAASHEKGVIHRDLKPQNVFLCRDGSLKLLDFGLARTLGTSRLAAKSAMLGTPGYVAPELAAGEPGDARSDLYAAGAILHELRTGRRAFDGDDPFSVLKAQRLGAPPEADAVVQRALHPDPERRYVSARQMLAALRGAQVPDAPAVPPALQPGDWTVHVTTNTVLLTPPWLRLRRVMKELGVRRPPLQHRPMLAQGVSRQTAEDLVALLEANGIAASYEPTEKPSWLRRTLAKVASRGLVARALTGGLGLAAIVAFAFLVTPYLRGKPELVGFDWLFNDRLTHAFVAAIDRRQYMEWTIILTAFALVYGAAIGATFLAILQPVLRVPAGTDGALARLARGLLLRLERTKDEKLREAARALHAQAEAAAASLGEGEARDSLVARLLATAAQLDAEPVAVELRNEAQRVRSR